MLPAIDLNGRKKEKRAHRCAVKYCISPLLVFLSEMCITKAAKMYRLLLLPLLALPYATADTSSTSQCYTHRTSTSTSSVPTTTVQTTFTSVARVTSTSTRTVRPQASTTSTVTNTAVSVTTTTLSQATVDYDILMIEA